MSTRGLIIVKGNIEEKNEDKMPMAVYNHSSSYPSWLGAKIRDMLWELWVPRYSPGGRDYELAKRELARRFLDWNKVRYAGDPEDTWKWPIKYENENDLNNNPGIDYIDHEWVYVVDFTRERFACYKTVWLENPELLPVEEWDANRGAVIKAFDVNFANMDELMGLNMRKIEDEIEEQAWRYKNETVYGMNREKYHKISRYITRRIHANGLEVVKRDISHGGITLVVENRKRDNRKYYVEMHFKKVDKDREFYKVELMFGVSKGAFYGTLDCAVVDDYKNVEEVIKQIANDEAAKMFIEQRMRSTDAPSLERGLEQLTVIVF